MRFELTEGHMEALASPRTREVFEKLARLGPASAPELQAALGTRSKSIYYHLRKLKAAGLVSEGSSGGVVRYESIGKEAVMPSGFQGARYEQLAAKRVEATLRRMSRRFTAASEAANRDHSLVDDQCILTADLTLPPELRLGFLDEVRDLFAKYERLSTTGSGRPLHCVFVTTPATEP